MVRAFRSLKPKVILTHQLDDPHPDHDHIARLARESARLSSMRNYDPESGADVIPVPRVAHNIFSRHVLPSFIVDISNFLEDKMAAIRAHTSQFHDPNSTEPETRLTDKRFLDELEQRSRYFGSLIGVEAGEPFYVRETLNMPDPVDLLTRPMNLYS
jgi:LmbE family N-acetylglucosaminyl deacetylase